MAYDLAPAATASKGSPLDQRETDESTSAERQRFSAPETQTALP